MTPRPHILFIDDEPAILSGLRRMLRAQRDRWDLSFAVGADEAITVLKERHCDAVVSDFRMPGIDGAGMLQFVREHHPGTARIILSGHADETDLLKVILLAHQFVHKPCTEDELIGAIERVLGLRLALTNPDVRREVSGIEFLPTPPSTLRDLLAALESEDASPASVARTLSQDPAIAAKILQLVNSSASGLSHRISSMSQAVSLIGLRNVRALLLLNDLNRQFHPPATAGVDWVGDLTRHSVQTSQLARDLSDGAPWVEDAFAAGLLLEIGQLVLASCRPDAFNAHFLSWLDGSDPLGDIEARDFGVDHAAAGAYLLGLWALPFSVIEAAAAHTNPSIPLDTSDVLPTVLLAHRLVETELGPVCSQRVNHPPVDEDRLDSATRERIQRWRVNLQKERTGEADDR
jgi:HD-like signal output (HDOD) protein/ActR/RegA family two-component response regulator